MKPSTPLKRAAGVTAVLVGLPVAGAEIPLLGSPPRRWDRRSRRISAVRSSRLPGSWWTLRGGPGNPRGRAGAGGAGGGLRSIRRGAFGASQLRPGGARLYWWNRTHPPGQLAKQPGGKECEEVAGKSELSTSKTLSSRPALSEAIPNGARFEDQSSIPAKISRASSTGTSSRPAVSSRYLRVLPLRTP